MKIQMTDKKNYEVWKSEEKSKSATVYKQYDRLPRKSCVNCEN